MPVGLDQGVADLEATNFRKEMITTRESRHSIKIDNNGIHRKRKIADADEIDLMDLLVSVLHFLSRYKLWFTASGGVGIVAGVAYFFAVTPQYKSEFIFDVSVLKKKALHHMVEQVNQYISEGNTGRIKGLEPNLVKEIKLKESTTDDNSHTISAIVTDPAYLPELQESLIAYINNNEFTKRKILSEKDMINETLQTLNLEQAKVDQVLNNITAFENQFLDIADIFKLKIEIQKEKIKLDDKLEHLQSVTVIQDFSQSSQPYNRNLLIFLLISGIGALFLALLIAGARDLYKLAARHQVR